MARNIDYPFHIDGAGQTATTTRQDHIRDMIEQVLFTEPGERVNRPEFGCGLSRLLFMPNSDPLAAATQTIVHGSLQQWLGDVIKVHAVKVENDEARLVVEVVYALLDTSEVQSATFTRNGGNP